jgi:DedD protein
MNTVDKSVADAEGFSPGAASGYRTRARQRLVGAIVLALGVAILMPLFFHGEPRMPRPELKITMPSRDATLEDALPAASGASGENRIPVGPQGGSSSGGAGEAQRGQGGESESTTQIPTPGSAAKATAAHADVPAGAKVDPSAAAKVDASPGAKVDAKSESKTSPSPGPKPDPKPDLRAERYTDQYVLQAGAYSQADNADAQVARLRKLGMKVYTERISTSRGDRIRVRVGPFSSRAEALRIQSKLRQAQVETSLAGPDA